MFVRSFVCLLVYLFICCVKISSSAVILQLAQFTVSRCCQIALAVGCMPHSHTHIWIVLGTWCGMVFAVQVVVKCAPLKHFSFKRLSVAMHYFALHCRVFDTIVLYCIHCIALRRRVHVANVKTNVYIYILQLVDFKVDFICVLTYNNTSFLQQYLQHKSMRYYRFGREKHVTKYR